MFPMGENTKNLKKYCRKSVFLKLSSNQPFDTWKAHVLIKIDTTLHPDTIASKDYEEVFSVPCISPTPLTITDKEGYVELIQHAMKSSKYLHSEAGACHQKGSSSLSVCIHCYWSNDYLKWTCSSSTSGSEGNLYEDKKTKKQKKMPTKKSCVSLRSHYVGFTYMMILFRVPSQMILTSPASLLIRTSSYYMLTIFATRNLLARASFATSIQQMGYTSHSCFLLGILGFCHGLNTTIAFEILTFRLLLA